MTIDLAALVLSRARRVPRPAELRGLGEAWRVAESTLVAEIAKSPRAGATIAARFERLARRAGEDEARGRAARLLSSAHAHVGSWQASADAADEAERTLSGAARDGARLGRALALLRLGRTGAAAAICRRVRTAAARRGDEALAAAARMNEAGARHEGGDAAAAIPLYRAARETFARLGRTHHAARAAEAEANACVLLDRFDEARRLFDTAAASFATAGLARDAARCRYDVGELLVATDRLGDAEEALLAAEEDLRAAGDTSTAALARVARGAALLRARLLPEARRVLASGERALDDRVPPVERARARLLVARAELAAGDPASARRALAAPLPHRSDETLGAREEILGRALAAEGQPRLALIRLRAAAARFGASRPSSRARALAAAAVVAAECGDAPVASRLAASAESIASRLPVPSLRFGAAAASFLAESARGRRPAADAALERAFDALEAVRTGLGGDAMRAALLTGSERWLARAVRHVLDGPGGARAALTLLERWRARALADLLAAHDSGTADRDDDLARRALRDRLAVLERRLADEALPGFLRSAGTPVRAVLREIRATERRLLRTTARTARPAPPPDVEGFLGRIDEGTCLVTLFADDSGGAAFVVDDRGVRVVHGLPGEVEVGALVEELLYRTGKLAFGSAWLERNGGRLAAEMESVLATLAARALAPLREDLLRARRIVVVPSGSWHRVPFAALPFEGGRLCDRVSVVLAPSIGALSEDVPEATAPPRVLAMADPRAPHIADEARRVAATLGGALLFEGPDARSDTLATGPAPSCVHLAAHGRFRSDAPALSAVQLADGWLRACELPRFPLAGSLVVLSGCDTGVARADPHGEVHGLVRGVLAAGAAEALLALWRVEDASTAEWMARFHAERDRGHDAEESLRVVQSRGAAEGLPPWAFAGFSLWTRRLRTASAGIITGLGGTTSHTAPPGHSGAGTGIARRRTA